MWYEGSFQCEVAAIDLDPAIFHHNTSGVFETLVKAGAGRSAPICRPRPNRSDDLAAAPASFRWIEDLISEER
jgi:hypothetical protein